MDPNAILNQSIIVHRKNRARAQIRSAIAPAATPNKAPVFAKFAFAQATGTVVSVPVGALDVASVFDAVELVISVVLT